MEMAPRVGLGEGFRSARCAAGDDGRPVRQGSHVPAAGAADRWRSDRARPRTSCCGSRRASHPAFRRRAATAERSLHGRVWLDEFRQWEQEWKPELIATNRAFGAVDPASLDDDGLARHLDAVVAHLERSTTLHFRLHTSDLGPIGLLLVRAREWGLDERMLMDVLVRFVALDERTGDDCWRRSVTRCDPTGDGAIADATSLDDLRRLERRGRRPDRRVPRPVRLPADDRVRHLRPHARRTARSRARLHPGRSREWASRSSTNAPMIVVLPRVAELRSTLSAEAAIEFDELVEDARLLYGLRDENGPITYEWPAGIVRRSVVEAGRRLERRDASPRRTTCSTSPRPRSPAC